jgi:hypothetical protein
MSKKNQLAHFRGEGDILTEIDRLLCGYMHLSELQTSLRPLSPVSLDDIDNYFAVRVDL